MAEKARMEVGELGDFHAGSRYGHITIGVAMDRASDGDAGSLVGSADKAIYGAKMAGCTGVMRFEAISA